jgi:hypothetical protein
VATPATTTESETGSAEDPADDPADTGAGNEQTGEHGDGEDNVTGDSAAKAKAAALAKVPGGKVGDISAEQADASKAADKPEAGDTPDPAYESQIAYDVEVIKDPTARRSRSPRQGRPGLRSRGRAGRRQGRRERKLTGTTPGGRACACPPPVNAYASYFARVRANRAVC